MQAPSDASPHTLRLPQATPIRIILFIGDGTGVGQWTAARVLTDTMLNVERLPVAGLVDTRADPQLVTDSASAATAYAAGIRTYNGAISVDRSGDPVETILERAEKRGMATGLVATSSLTHATPAAFAAHVRRRTMEGDIAEQMAGAGIEVLLGGGRGWFDGSLRTDGRDLYARMRDTYHVVEDRQALIQAGRDPPERILGLFGENEMPAFAERSPTLPEMTEVALKVLNRDPDGFFLMVEGSQVDWRSHDREPIEIVAAEVFDLDRAIGVALAYQAEHPETVIVVTADHETGGMGVITSRRRTVAAYIHGEHTANMVPIFAGGPGTERFSGILDNHIVGQRLGAYLDPPGPEWH